MEQCSLTPGCDDPLPESMNTTDDLIDTIYFYTLCANPAARHTRTTRQFHIAATTSKSKPNDSMILLNDVYMVPIIINAPATDSTNGHATGCFRKPRNVISVVSDARKAIAAACKCGLMATVIPKNDRIVINTMVPLHAIKANTAAAPGNQAKRPGIVSC